VVNFHVEHGSTVNLCFLDMSKAFDKVNHYALYCKLMDRNIPPRFIKLLINWYGKCFSAVRWNNVFSSFLKLSYGVRQLFAFCFLLYMLMAYCVDWLIVS